MSEEQRLKNLKNAIEKIPSEMRIKLLSEVLTIDWNFTETSLLNWFANYAHDDKELEKIIRRIGIIKNITMKELPEFLKKEAEKN